MLSNATITGEWIVLFIGMPFYIEFIKLLCLAVSTTYSLFNQ
ncbi:hypothetical protein M917_2376 [Psychrobacter aquaticus CMS 56]|uniref:Uncharacterized protein n=1 Tax=Psychrobacter aquaticus CMS 56 TaxID=1354303 RepID=U4T303_9GAMM|nr:hypothetical protein M917_2376 [Psychrobacter aquaticus CMS 56]